MKQRVKAKITRVVTETVICVMDYEGNVEEVEDVLEEHDYEVQDVVSVIDVINDW